MDKLITINNGGMPFDLDDLRWIENGITESFKAIATGLNPNSLTAIRMFGAIASDAGSTFNVSAGAVFYDNEIWLVESHSVAKLTVSGSWYWKQVITFDSTGSETFENGATVDTYQKRRLELTNSEIDGAAGSGTIGGLHLSGLDTAFTLKTVFDTLDSQINNSSTGIDTNLNRSAHLRQLMNVGSSYGSYSDLTSSYSHRSGDPELHASGNSLGIVFKKYRLYRIEINCPNYSTDVVRIKNVPSDVDIYSGFASRDGSGNVDIDPSETRSIILGSKSSTDAVLTVAVKFDGNLVVNFTDIGEASYF